MTQPLPQMNFERVLQRGTEAVGVAVARIAADLAVAEELAEMRGARVVELEKEAGVRDAELRDLRQANEALQARIVGLEARGDAEGG